MQPNNPFSGYNRIVQDIKTASGNTVKVVCEYEPRDQVRDLDMVLHPDKWPLGLILPLRHVEKRDPNNPNLPLLGFVLADKPTHVCVGCVHLVVLGVQEIETLAEEAYQSVSEMLKAGWTVD